MSNLTARDVMTSDVRTVNDQATLKEAVEILTSAKISGLPVVDRNGVPVGIISETDLLDEKKRNAVIPKLGFFGLWVVPDELVQEAYQEGMSLRVREIMSSDIVTAEEHTTLQELADLMLSRDVNRVPILRDGKLVGIVTRQDVLRGIVSQKARD